MYASAGQLSSQPEAFANDAGNRRGSQPCFACELPGCSLEFGNTEERDAHTISFHLGQDRPPETNGSDTTWDAWVSVAGYHDPAEQIPENPETGLFSYSRLSEATAALASTPGNVESDLEALVDPSLFLG